MRRAVSMYCQTSSHSALTRINENHLCLADLDSRTGYDFVLTPTLDTLAQPMVPSASGKLLIPRLRRARPLLSHPPLVAGAGLSGAS